MYIYVHSAISGISSVLPSGFAELYVTSQLVLLYIYHVNRHLGIKGLCLTLLMRQMQLFITKVICQKELQMAKPSSWEISGTLL